MSPDSEGGRPSPGMAAASAASMAHFHPWWRQTHSSNTDAEALRTDGRTDESLFSGACEQVEGRNWGRAAVEALHRSRRICYRIQCSIWDTAANPAAALPLYRHQQQWQQLDGHLQQGVAQKAMGLFDVVVAATQLTITAAARGRRHTFAAHLQWDNICNETEKKYNFISCQKILP